MDKPLWIATIAVWVAVVALLLFYGWRHSRKPPEQPTKNQSNKPKPPAEPPAEG